MQLITSHLREIPEGKPIISLKVDRRKLAKRRWRGKAADGTEFGFDLDHPLEHGTPFHQNEENVYVIEQNVETVLKIPFQGEIQAARFGWMIGNMHFPATFTEDAILAEDDSAVRQLLERNNIPYQETTAVFKPAVSNTGHHH